MKKTICLMVVGLLFNSCHNGDGPGANFGPEGFSDGFKEECAHSNESVSSSENGGKEGSKVSHR